MAALSSSRCRAALEYDAGCIRAEIAALETELALLPRPDFHAFDGDDGGSENRAEIEMLEGELFAIETRIDALE